MLALLSAPRGRVSAARVAARAREHERAETPGDVIHLPRVPAASATPERRAGADGSVSRQSAASNGQAVVDG
ncbi:MAG TPA: hypothetical protein VEQ60_28005 [Longimicrobium sp.]|nr:hypothetical protein [Longimicrobium sp.]